ncbi:hypothetical protein D3C77_168620 [compost metagenome]
MKLTPIDTAQIDFAWRDGAYALSKACDTSGGEITGDQLKMILSRGERTLLRLDGDEKTVGWAVVRVDQLPNMRVMMVTDLVAPHGHFEHFFEPLREMCYVLGCSSIRCAAKPAQERLYRMRCGFKPVYQIMEIPI